MKVFILLLNWNGKSDTLACLQSLEQLTYSNHEIVVIDNGSVDDSVVQIQQAFPNITLLKTGENLGFAGGNNVGITYALGQNADAILLLNNDTEVAPDLLNGYVEMLSTNPNAVLGGRVYQFDNRDQFDHLGGFWNPKKANFDLLAGSQIDDGKSWEQPISVDFVCGCALFASAETFRSVGLLEEKFFLIWEEADWCARAKRLNHPILYCPKARLWHKISASFTGGKPHIQYYWWRNRLLWISRNCVNFNRFALIKEASHILKLYLLKRVQLLFSHSELRAQKVLCYRAALKGIGHHIIGRYGKLLH